MQLNDAENLTVEEIDRPQIKSDEVSVEVKACGICGTDLHIYHGDPGSTEVDPPIVLGHEMAGEVVAVGSQVEHLQLHDRVSIDPNIYCGTCKFCREGRKHLCDRLQAVGVTRNGGMARYSAVPAENAYLIPGNLSYEQGALIEPLGCVLHGASQLHLSPDQSAVVIGGGFIGQLMLQVLKTHGLKKITVVEPVEEKRRFLYELGAETVQSPGQVLQADIAVECVGASATMKTAIEATAKGGQVLLFGVASPKTTIEISPYEIFSKELVVRGSFINPDTHQKAIEMVGNGQVQVDSLISHRFSLEQLPEVMGNYKSLKVNKGLILL